MKKSILAIVLCFVLMFTAVVSAQEATVSETEAVATVEAALDTISAETGVEKSTLVGAGVAVFAGLGILGIIIAIVWYVLQVVAEWKIFTKAGKPGWHSIIPILNNWDVVDMSWSRTMAWVILVLGIVACILGGMINGNQNPSGFITVVAYIVAVIAGVLGLITNYKLAKAFGKGFGYFLGLLFLNPIFKLILGFGGAEYQGRQ